MKAAVTSIRDKRALKVNNLSSKLATPKDMNVNAEPQDFYYNLTKRRPLYCRYSVVWPSPNCTTFNYKWNSFKNNQLG